jgi:hypothetical protein
VNSSKEERDCIQDEKRYHNSLPVQVLVMDECSLFQIPCNHVFSFLSLVKVLIYICTAEKNMRIYGNSAEDISDAMIGVLRPSKLLESAALRLAGTRVKSWISLD